MKKSQIEKDLHAEGLRYVCGLDEAGRGPWAGPVVSAAVILPSRLSKLAELNDSKQLSATTRAELYTHIMSQSIYGIGIVSHTEIDKIGIIEATFSAYEKAISGLTQNPEYILIDGRDQFFFGIPKMSIVKGDTKIQCIAAASILAKVIRDRIMEKYHVEFPQYGFDEHKGYGVARHHQALNKYGPSPIHRFSYEPIKHMSL